MKTVIIAEAGVNHNGSVELGIRLIDAAKAAGADFVKFQSFKAKTLVQESAKKAAYQERTTGAQETQFEMIRKLELSASDHDRLYEHCRQVGIGFLSTPFDEESLDMLVERYPLPVIKISSGDLTNSPFLYRVARKQIDVILSTGMAEVAEIERAVSTLAWGFLNAAHPTSTTELETFAATDRAREVIQKRISLLHCTTEYPAPFEEVNLTAMLSLRDKFHTRVGYSDHTPGIAIPVAAVSLGAAIIEKHFTLDRKMEGPDHAASLEPSELTEMIRSIRAVERSLGDGVKRPTPSELKNREVARRSIIVKAPIEADDTWSWDHLTFKRPGTGVSPEKVWDLIGRRAKRAHQVGQSLSPDELPEM